MTTESGKASAAENNEAKKEEWEPVQKEATAAKAEEKKTELKSKPDVATTNAEVVEITSPAPSITVSLLVFWVLPVLLLTFASRYMVDTTTTPKPNIPKERQGPLKIPQKESRKMMKKPSSTPSPSKKARLSPKPTPLPSASPNWPTSYRETIDIIQKRNRKVARVGTTASKSEDNSKKTTKPGSTPPTRKPTSTPSSSSSSSSSSNSQGASRDPVRAQYEEKIDAYREAFESDPDNVLKAIKLADSLRLYDVTYHDGGTKQPEALRTYEKAIDMAIAKRQQKLENGEDTNLSLSGTRNVRDEVMMDYSQKSVDGLLCALYTAMGKVYFMANMFERAVESYSKCLELEPLYLDALGSRGSSLIILGKYEEAGKDLMDTIRNDEQNLFNDAYTGLARILQAKEDVLAEGWTPIVSKLDELIPSLEGMISSVPTAEGKKMIANTLNRLHHVMFTYHDVKTKDTSEAWDHLSQSYKHKMAALPPWQSGFEKQKITQTMQIFHKGFWPSNVGSDTEVPIFIVGFVRSGSTLLERVLDAHPDIVGTGEDSVFNGRLDKIRNEIVQASVVGDPSVLASTIEKQASEVVAEMKSRWEVIDANTAKPSDTEARSETRNPKRFVDKMLNNYYNIGFIHMLFPKALILHVIREPMDTIFSAYKHEFPPGTLDYTSDFSSLAELYHSYRDLMDHWDRELPGRVTHIRYEDLVRDMPGMAKAIIDATGLEWHDDVLEFHKKKHAVNTLSTTQVRKGIYKDSLQAWRKYEEQLKPLVELIGERVHANRETTLPKYEKPEAA